MEVNELIINCNSRGKPETIAESTSLLRAYICGAHSDDSQCTK